MPSVWYFLFILDKWDAFIVLPVLYCNRTETEYVSQMLTKIKRFAQHHSCHVWFVAHPRQVYISVVVGVGVHDFDMMIKNILIFSMPFNFQLQNWTGSPPNLYDISGSAHFMNKCDNGVVIHRNRDENAGPLDSVKVARKTLVRPFVSVNNDLYQN